MLIWRYSHGAITLQAMKDMVWSDSCWGFFEWLDSAKSWAEAEAQAHKVQEKT